MNEQNNTPIDPGCAPIPAAAAADYTFTTTIDPDVLRVRRQGRQVILGYACTCLFIALTCAIHDLHGFYSGTIRSLPALFSNGLNTLWALLLVITPLCALALLVTLNHKGAASYTAAFTCTAKGIGMTTSNTPSPDFVPYEQIRRITVFSGYLMLETHTNRARLILRLSDVQNKEAFFDYLSGKCPWAKWKGLTK